MSRQQHPLFLVAAACLVTVLSACGGRAAEAPTATAAPAATATTTWLSTGGVPTPTVRVFTPTPTSAPAVELVDVGSKSLYILHTNDVIGYTDPCG